MNPLAHLRRAFDAPAFALSVLLTVMLVVLINASAFAGLWALLYQPLPYRDAGELVELRLDLRDIDFQVGLSPSLYAAVKDSKHSFAGTIGSVEVGLPQYDEQQRPWLLQRISADFTQVLGVMPALGSGFDSPLAAADPNSILLSDRAWRERLGADSHAIGQSLRIGKVEHRIVGIMPPGFAWPDSSVLGWSPWIATANELEQDANGAFGQFHVTARLAPGVGLIQAQQTLRTLLAEANNPMLREPGDRLVPQVRPWRQRFSAEHLPLVLLLQAAAVLLLLVAAANLSSLTLDRLWAGRRGYAIRSALGATPGRLLALISADLLLPAIGGAAFGMALMPVGNALMQSRGLLPDNLPLQPGADATASLYGWASAALLLGVAIITARVALWRDARAGTLSERAPARGLGRAQALALVVQIALTTTMAGSAGLLIRSAINLANEERGFEPNGVLLTQIDLGSDAAPAATVSEIEASLRRLPGVSSVATADMPPFGGAEFVMAVAVAGLEAPIQTRVASISADYFKTLGMPLLSGNDFTAADFTDAQAIIVDERFRQRWLAAGNALTAHIGEVDDQGIHRPLRIIGVVPSVKQKALDEDSELATLYRPLVPGSSVLFLVTRTERNPGELAEQARRLIASLAPDATITVNRPLTAAVDLSLHGRRALLQAVTLFALVTVLLAALGLFAAINASVRRRSAEFGVRMALGGPRRRILMLVLGESGGLLGAGLLLGLTTGLAFSAVLATRLHHLVPSDPLTWICTALTIVAVGLVATAVPATRAIRVSPRQALEATARWDS
jgi:putative ABC transport system permease protein